MTAVLVPQLSLSMEEAKVSRWLVEDGDAVAAGQLVVEVETDKATVEVEAPAAGLVRIVAREGAVVPVDGVLAELEPSAPEVTAVASTDDDWAVRRAGIRRPPGSFPVGGCAHGPAVASGPDRVSRSASPGTRGRSRARVAPRLGPRGAHRRA